jgi:carbonic anhydrase/acetyltransferase-like protein (isoleucine patch superfamily)
MKNDKFKLTKETKQLFGKTLYRIEALKDFALILKGDKGGWVEKETNLSVSGNAWVFGNARVYGNAEVYGDAEVSGNAWVSGNARVYGDAEVFGNAWVSGNARVYGDAEVFGNAWVYGNAEVFGKLRIKAGLFFGMRWSHDTNIKEVEVKDQHYLVYKGNAEFGEAEPDVEEMTMEQVNKALGKTVKIIE